MLKSVFLSSAALAVLILPASAQSQAGFSVPQEDVVVTATRIATPLDQVASSITVIDAADIESRQQRSLPDVLRDVPGLNLVQAGGEGGQASIFMRGSNSNHTKVLVDGIEDSDPSKPNGAYDFGKFNSADIARVEVLRGPQSGLYGSDAIGGVINVITKSGNGPLAVSATAEGGSFDTFNQSATVSGSEDAFYYRASLAHLHAGATPVTPLDLLPPGQKRNDDFFDNVTASTKLGYDLADGFNLGFVGRYSNSLSKVTGDAFDPVTFASFPSPLQTRIDTLSYNARATAHLVLGSIDQTIGFGYSSTVTSDMDPDNGPIPSSGDRIKLEAQLREIGRSLNDRDLAIAIAQTSVFLSTATADGQPYIQHRGGPAGFLRVFDDKTIGFADFAGNRQYITLGNLADNPKAFLFLIDYAHRQRIKIWGEARVVEGDAALIDTLMPRDYRARPEQAILFTVSAWDANCKQHIPQRFDSADVAAALAERDHTIAILQAEIAQWRDRAKDATTDAVPAG